MDTKTPVNTEKKPWVKPQLVIYGNIEKLTTELPGKRGGPSGNL